MKRFLAVGFLLVSSAVMAQAERPSRGCSILIGQNWIPMSAITINGCFKFAEAAATPGERQLAAFGSSTLAFKNGQYFLSNDGGNTWVNAHPRQTQTVMSSLNKLPSPDETAAAAKKAKDDSRLVPDPPSMPAPVPVPAPVQAPAPVAVQQTPVPVPEQVPTPVSESAQTSLPAAAEPVDVVPTKRPRVTTQSAPGEIVPAAPSTMQICQLKDGADKWQRYPFATLEQCGAKLAEVTAQSGAKSGQAYWAGSYLFYSMQTLYQSPDGEHWLPLQ